MFKPHNMKKTTILGLNRDRNKILLNLHRLGLIQPTNLKGSDYNKILDNVTLTDDLTKVSEQLIDVSRLINILKIPPRKLNFTQKTFGLDFLEKKIVKRKDVEEILSEGNEFLDKYKDDLTELESSYNKCLDKDEQHQETTELIELFNSVGIPVELIKDTKFTSIITGIILTQNIEKLKNTLEKESDGHYYIQSKEYSKKESIIVIITLKEYSSNANFITKRNNVNLFTIPELPKGKNLVEWINSETQSNQDAKKKIIGKIKAYQRKLLKEGTILREEIEILKERLEVLHGMLQSSSSFLIQGWVIDKNVPKLERELTKITNNHIVFSITDPSKEDNPPIELTNPKFLKPFEMLTELFSMPSYGDLDPTFIVAPLFLIFAGFMLTDAVYGLFMIALGWVILTKFAKYSTGFRDMSISIIGIGIFTTLFGILTGSYFGDLPYYLFGLTTDQLAIWKDPLKDPLYFLIISLIVGIIHVNIGLLLGALEDIRKKAWKSLVKERLIWYVLQIGVLLIVFKQTALAGKIILGFSILGIIVMTGPLGLLDITGLMGDIISYARLFALALSTAGIAMAVNLLAQLVNGIPFIGIVLMVLVFIVGHVFGFIMNALGAFVHSLRLQFVEFFGKFYEGGGDKFMPLREERIYTDIVNE